MDQLVKAINKTKEYVIVTCVTTDMMKTVVDKQKLVTGFSNTVSDIITANVLMTNTMKDSKEEININLKTDGMVSEVISNGDFDGNFTGYAVLNNQKAERIIGNGIFNVNRYYNGHEISNSQIAATSRNISDVVVDYYFQSEQVYSVVNLASLCDKKTNEFYGSGGILIQLLPNASEEIKEEIADKMSQIEQLSKKIALGMSAEEIVKLVDEEAEILTTKQIQFNCKCSREHTLESIKTIESDEIEKILEEDGKLQVVCNACNEVYVFNEEDFLIS